MEAEIAVDRPAADPDKKCQLCGDGLFPHDCVLGDIQQAVHQSRPAGLQWSGPYPQPSVRLRPKRQDPQEPARCRWPLL